MNERAFDRTTRIGTGLALILAPLTFLAGFALHPAETTDAAQQIRIVVERRAAWDVAHLLLLLSGCLFIPVILAVQGRARGRGRWLGLIGAAFAAVGLIASGAAIGLDGLANDAFATLSAPERAASLPAIQALLDLRGIASVSLLFAALMPGFCCLGLALFVARTEPRWVALAIAAGGLLAICLALPPLKAVGLLGAALLLIGFGALGVRQLRGDAAVPSPVAAGPAPLQA